MSKDPFVIDEEDDRTILQPRRQGSASQSVRGSDRSTTAGSPAELPLLDGINKLEQAASRLLPLLITIKNSSSHPNPEKLRNDLILELEQFKRRVQQVLDDPKKVTQASYVMCTVLDEAAMNTPWGHQANWSQYNLLATFHNEVTGGERFFDLLKALGKNPADNIDLLELMYVCLSLGYEGSYRITPKGQETLVKVRRWLYEVIQSVRDKPHSALAMRWHGSNIQERKLPRLTPVWVLAAGALAVASIVYLSLRISLSTHADEAVAQFWDAEVAPLTVRTVTPSVKKRVVATKNNLQAQTLTELLQADITGGSLEVVETFDSGRIRLLGTELFASGRTEFNADHAPLISRVTEALNKFDGNVLVTGHSDNVPVRSGRYSSNLELSRARAESVRSQILQRIDNPERIIAEGRGSLEPIADNATADGRSQNRRVEISVFF